MLTPAKIKDMAETLVGALPIEAIDDLWSKPGAAEEQVKKIHTDESDADHARLIGAIREAAHWRRFKENGNRR